MKKLAIIGASYLQEPLIEKAKSMGIETHVFAWAAGDVGEKSADYFYPISIVEKDEILKRCREIGIDGICTIASDLAVITVNYVANNMGLTANSIACTEKSTNKFLDKIKQKTEKLNLKYIMAGLVVGIIANISIYHYQSNYYLLNVLLTYLD